MRLDWSANQTPTDLDAGDRFYADEGGLLEAQHVFVNHNALPERFTIERDLRIGELGFGSGLNFLATYKAWRESTRPAGALLHYVSFDRQLWDPLDIRRALSVWPELSPFLAEFLDVYEPFATGTYRYLFDDRSLRLTLIVGDVAQTLPPFAALGPQIDAWYLDGFAPQKNPEMWTPDVFENIRRCSRPDATLATYTSAGFVRRGLTSAGFDIQKSKGFGRKREMLSGRLPSAHATAIDARSPTVSIIGGGIAGVSLAASLSQRGAKVQLFEKESELVSRASGARGALVCPVLTSYESLATHLSLANFQMFRSLKPQDFLPLGVLQLQESPKDLLRSERGLEWTQPRAEFCKLVSAEDASTIAQVAISSHALYFAKAGFVALRDFAKDFEARAINLDVRLSTQITSIERSTRGHWTLRSQHGEEFESEIVVVASSLDAKAFEALGWLPFLALRGQSLEIPPTTVSQRLRTVVFGTKSITPLISGRHFLGATFGREPLTAEIRAEDNEEILNHVDQMLPSLEISHASPRQAWAGLRAFSAQKLPIVGEAVDHRGAILPGIYLSVAHGSKGVLNAPMAAEVIAAKIFREPLPLKSDLVEALHPARHWLALTRRDH